MRGFIDELLTGIAAFGNGRQGWNRLGFSQSDREARLWFASKMREAGLVTRTDAFGNIFGRLKGKDDSLPVVATGSHLDTVPDGGNYDGVLGCVAGLAAIAEIRKSGGNRQPLELVIFQIEESTRFACSTLGSKILCGMADPGHIAKLVDRNGISLPEVMAEAGLMFEPAKIRTCALNPGVWSAFIELHMDQGPVLEEAGRPLGIVTGIVGVRRARIYFEGQALHAGATPMKGRRDALLSASMAVLELNRIAARHKGQMGMVATAGNLRVEPGAINVIPSRTMLHCEMRCGDGATLEKSWDEFDKALKNIAVENNTPVEITLTERSAPVMMNREIQNALREACERNNAGYLEMFSGAGHDCMNIARFAPSGMLFVRNRGGVSHHPSEYVRADDALLACEILRDTLISLAK